MTTLIARLEELEQIAEAQGIDLDEVHHYDIGLAIEAWSDRLGFRLPDALDPDLPLEPLSATAPTL